MYLIWGRLTRIGSERGGGDTSKFHPARRRRRHLVRRGTAPPPPTAIRTSTVAPPLPPPTLTMAGGREALLRQHLARDMVWRHLDARGQPLGRLAVAAASLLLGKHKPTAMTSVWAGDPVLITHADAVVLTGRKASTKVYRRHSGYPGGLTVTPFAQLQRRQPGEAIRRAVRGMLPGNALRAVRMGHLYVVPGGDHPHAPHRPVTMPPPGGGGRLGRGGGATRSEVGDWWANLLVDVGEADVRRLVAEVKAEMAAGGGRGGGGGGGVPAASPTSSPRPSARPTRTMRRRCGGGWTRRSRGGGGRGGVSSRLMTRRRRRRRGRKRAPRRVGRRAGGGSVGGGGG
ncbi:hypothetical protein BU14_0103s0004 [Porphyra umbilicalis]|uniref:Ribosomal protein L13 n=1 Tax=Porphyra umbilicalis TaxID=2786 RepID=A0A1X6PD46_PORUM|nr:hypothetical protein BU14_0103s0004 [Porphyra umbilicalis]|eukprot:OSX78660.1 hypothetical protein BU14_0103s0004 [Porphyra umbilicalis]